MKRYYLATTAISEIWDLDNELVFLGPWCLRRERNRDIARDRDYQFVPSPWKPACKIKEAEDYCSEIYERLLPQLTIALNSIHHRNYPIKYWRILIGPWLLHFIWILYDRYIRIVKAAEYLADFFTSALPLSQRTITYLGTYEFLYNDDEDYFNLKMFSIITSHLYPSNVQIKSFVPVSKMHRYQPRSDKRRSFISVLINQLNISSKQPIVLSDMYHLNTNDKLLLKLKDRFKTFRFIDLEPINKSLLKVSYSVEIRNMLKLKEGDDEFQLLLNKILPEAIPMCYIENYGLYRQSTNTIEGLDSVNWVGSAVGWFYNESFKFFAAEAVARGAHLMDFQHGGAYGMPLSVSVEKLCLEKDIFYSWGWHSKENNNIKSLPNPHLSKLKNTSLQKFDVFLFVGTATTAYLWRFHTTLLPEDMPRYIEDKKIFLQALPERVRNKILYRPWIQDYGWGELEEVKKVCPDVKFLLDGKLIEYMRRVKLVVIDHPHTSFIEALAINVPCIFYWNHDIFLMRPEAEEYFSYLRQAGILYRTPKEAADKLIEMYDNPMIWWNSDEVKRVRHIFLERFGYSRKNWRDIWVREMQGLIKSD